MDWLVKLAVIVSISTPGVTLDQSGPVPDLEQVIASTYLPLRFETEAGCKAFKEGDQIADDEVKLRAKIEKRFEGMTGVKVSIQFSCEKEGDPA